MMSFLIHLSSFASLIEVNVFKDIGVESNKYNKYAQSVILVTKDSQNDVCK